LGKSSGKEKLTVFVKPPVVKHLAGQHDQSTHGSWAGTTSFGSGSGLSAQEINNLRRGVGTKEYQQKELYNAENEALKKVKPSFIEMPEPKESSYLKFGDLPSYKEIKKAERQYKKDWYDWSAERNKYIESELGAKHLDGSVKGLRNYLNAVIDSDWFREEYGVTSIYNIDNGKKFAQHQPEIKFFSTKKYAGMYRFRDFGKTGKQSSIDIDRSYSKNEQVILHEIAHYANAISATTKFSGHGYSFGRELLKIAKQFMPKYADALEQSFKDGGIKYGE
jgi:hypothetical protein